MTTERDIQNQIAYAEKKGREEGIEEGRMEGREEGVQSERLRIADNLRQQGVPEEIIERVTRSTENQ